MALELTDAEREFLLEILRDRLGTLREQVYHSTTSTFTDELKQREESLRGIIQKIEVEQDS